MTREEFQQLSYQDKWYHLVEWAMEHYKRHPYLYYVLHVLTDTYQHSMPFDAAVIRDLHYNFD